MASISLSKRVFAFMLSMLLSLGAAAECDPYDPVFTLSSLSYKLLLIATWNTKDTCPQEISYKQIGESQFTSKTASYKTMPGRCQHTATVAVNAAKYQVSLGKSGRPTKDCFLDFSLPTATIKRPLMRVFVLAGISAADNNGNATSAKIVSSVLAQIKREEGFNLIVDLGGQDAANPTSDPGYYSLLAPVLQSIPYQTVPRLTSEYPFNSPYSIEFKGALLHFPLVEGFNASSEASVLALETSLNVPFGESSGGVKVIFQHPELNDEDTDNALLKKLYEEKGVNIMVSGSDAKIYNKRQRGPKAPAYIINGNGKSYGVLTMWNATHYTYEQFGTDGKVIDSFSSFVEILQRNDDHSKEKVMAIIVMCCSLAFLCYFIYSWVSCYMKRPRIREPQPQEPSGEMHEESATSGEEGYDMRPTPNAP